MVFFINNDKHNNALNDKIIFAYIKKYDDKGTKNYDDIGK